MNRNVFGCHLGIPHTEVPALLNSGDQDHPAVMIRIFECWNRQITDDTKKTWGCILSALGMAGCPRLASEIESDLCNTST
jgi:hypothetical protein